MATFGCGHQAGVAGKPQGGGAIRVTALDCGRGSGGSGKAQPQDRCGDLGRLCPIYRPEQPSTGPIGQSSRLESNTSPAGQFPFSHSALLLLRGQ